MSRLDVVVFGASGYTGKHVVERLSSIAGQRGHSWAVAGRSKKKLDQMLKDVSDATGQDVSSTKVLIADVENEQSLRDMCEQAKVLVNCCGPYTLYGEAVVKAAIQSRTHYVDVSGEPNFIELMHLKYEGDARAAGVYVVSACGCESIPVDLGILFLQKNFGGVLNSAECYMSPGGHEQSINVGTWNSMLYCFTQYMKLYSIRKKIYPTPLPKFTPKLKYRILPHKRLNGWCLPLPGNDISAAYRTQRYFYEKEGTRPAQCTTYVRFDSFINALAVAISFIFIFVMSQFKVTREILMAKCNAFSFGIITHKPSESAIRRSRIEFRIYGVGWDESDADEIDSVPPRKSMIAKVSAANPGYGLTALALLYSAFMILEEQHNMPPGGGVMTPGIAFCKTGLVKHLQDNEIAFQIVGSKLHHE